uniref:Uncharacterized protein n=1 Tax=Fopius arisanus TaxID=64838 RepID=A0A0C9Q9V9_9HYME
MSPIWSSSERPISVRTVWVDGVRHAILTPDDPVLSLQTRQRPFTSTLPTKSKSPSVKYMCSESVRNSESLDSCFVNFHVVVNKKDVEEQRKVVARRQSAPINPIEVVKPLDLELNGILKIRNSNTASNDNENDSGSNATETSINNNTDSNYNHIEDLSANCVTIVEDCDNDHGIKRISSNTLSDRVLHWLNMSGCVKTGEKKEMHTINYIKNRKSLVRAKVCSFRRQNSGVSRDLVTIQHYKLSMKKPEYSIPDFNRGNENSMDKQPFDVSQRKKSDFKYRNLSLNNQSVWSPIVRPQLHIFMPDLISSGESTSSLDTLVQDESSQHSEVN